MRRVSGIKLPALGVALSMLTAMSAHAQSAAKYDPGATDKVIKIGTTAPLSGPVSAFAQIAKSAEAYFNKVNDEGGVNGRRIQMIIVDDAYSPPKTVEQARRLVVDALPRAADSPGGRQRRSSSALVTTLTLDSAIAAPASTGLNSPNAASGMPITL